MTKEFSDVESRVIYYSAFTRCARTTTNKKHNEKEMKIQHFEYLLAVGQSFCFALCPCFCSLVFKSLPTTHDPLFSLDVSHDRGYRDRDPVFIFYLLFKISLRLLRQRCATVDVVRV
jgi:hypothetical protein